MNSINSNLSLHSNADSRKTFHRFAATVAAERHAPDIPITAAARSFDKNNALPEFGTVERAWLNHQALSPEGSGSAPVRSAGPASSAVQVAFDKLGDRPPMTHWGINE